jgi:hypothetical protein
MEKQSGVMLTDMWDNIKGSQKADILKHIVRI